MNNWLKKYAIISNSIGSVLFWSTVSLIIVIILLIILLVDRNLYIELSKESANAELLTAFFYLTSGIVLLIASYQNIKKKESKLKIIFILLFALFFIFIAGEEESWGQWFFNYKISESVKNISCQKEYNIHNLVIFNNYFFTLNSHMVLNLIVISIGILIPLSYKYIRGIRTILNKICFPVCPLSCIAIFILGILFEKIAMSVISHWSHAEIREFLFSIGFLLFSISVFKGHNMLGKTENSG